MPHFVRVDVGEHDVVSDDDDADNGVGGYNDVVGDDDDADNVVVGDHDVVGDDDNADNGVGGDAQRGFILIIIAPFRALPRFHIRTPHTFQNHPHI